MRRSVLFFFLLTAATLLYLISSVWTLLTLLIVSGASDAITKAELPDPGTDLHPVRPQLIPKILHQTYKNASIPTIWQDAQASCLALHTEPEWEYRLWTDETADEFINTEYPWFLETFRGYKFNIQRADAIRYFVLARYGGVYIDLDDGCNRPLDPLLSYPAFARRTKPTGISNDVLGAVPQHPFFLGVIKEIAGYDRSWLLPYITIMGSTGPLFLSVIWRRFSAAGHNFGDGMDGGRIRLIFPEEYNDHAWSFFTHHVGNSWHSYDVDLIFWLARNWIVVTILGFATGGFAIFSVWWAYHRFALSSSADVPRLRMGSLRHKLPSWRRTSGWKNYELVNRHEV